MKRIAYSTQHIVIICIDLPINNLSVKLSSLFELLLPSPAPLDMINF